MFGHVKNLLRSGLIRPRNDQPAPAVSAAPAPVARRIALAGAGPGSAPRASTVPSKRPGHRTAACSPSSAGCRWNCSPSLRHPDAGAPDDLHPAGKDSGPALTRRGENPLWRITPGRARPFHRGRRPGPRAGPAAAGRDSHPAQPRPHHTPARAEASRDPGGNLQPVRPAQPGPDLFRGPGQARTGARRRPRARLRLPRTPPVAPPARSGLTFAPTPPPPAAAPPQGATNQSPLARASRAEAAALTPAPVPRGARALAPPPRAPPTAIQPIVGQL